VNKFYTLTHNVQGGTEEKHTNLSLYSWSLTGFLQMYHVFFSVWIPSLLHKCHRTE
jgi:hypothetical protein